VARPPWIRLWLLALLAASACGENDPGPGDPPPASLSVEVGNDFFRGLINRAEPAVDTVSVNGTVTWTWIELGEHGVVFDDPELPMSDVMSEIGSQHSQTFSAPGTFAYTCSIHGPSMSGSVVVR
jgi:copper binding plastocyanin/azurin family protein